MKEDGEHSATAGSRPMGWGTNWKTLDAESSTHINLALPLIEDIASIMSNPRVAQYVLRQRQDLLSRLLALQCYSQGMDPMLRRTDVHVKMESRSWMLAFKLSLYLRKHFLYIGVGGRNATTASLTTPTQPRRPVVASAGAVHAQQTSLSSSPSLSSKPASFLSTSSSSSSRYPQHTESVPSVAATASYSSQHANFRTFLSRQKVVQMVIARLREWMGNIALATPQFEHTQRENGGASSRSGSVSAAKTGTSVPVLPSPFSASSSSPSSSSSSSSSSTTPSSSPSLRKITFVGRVNEAGRFITTGACESHRSMLSFHLPLNRLVASFLLQGIACLNYSYLPSTVSFSFH